MANGIEWARVAEPQVDGYDTAVVEQCRGYQKPVTFESKALLYGVVVAFPMERPVPEFAERRRDDSLLREVDDALRKWPALFNQTGRLLDAMAPYRDARSAGSYGYSCHMMGERYFHCSFGSVAGGLSALCFAVRHVKLCAIGVDTDQWSRLIKNSPTEDVPHPTRGTNRMGALFHAHLQFLYEAEAHWRARSLIPEVHMQALARQHQDRLTMGTTTLLERFKGDAAGREFVDGMLDWTDRTLKALAEVTNLKRRSFTI